MLGAQGCRLTLGLPPQSETRVDMHAALRFNRVMRVTSAPNETLAKVREPHCESQLRLTYTLSSAPRNG
jgi:hypothetical protein